MQRSDWLLVAVVLCSAGLDLLELGPLQGQLTPSAAMRIMLGLHGVLVAALLGFSLLYARNYALDARPAAQLLAAWACAVLGVAMGLAPGEWVFIVPPSHWSEGTGSPMFTSLGLAGQAALLVATVMAMYNLEATLANAALGLRWRIKFTVLGVFSMLIALLFIFSQSVLYRMPDPAFGPMRSTGSLLGLLLVGYSIFFRGPEARVVISRRLVYKSFVLLAGGVFLLFLALAAYIAKAYHLSLDRTAIWSAVLVSGIGLGAFLLSQGVRRKALLFLKHHFYKDKYDYRVQWLDFTRRLTSGRTGASTYEAALTGFCETLGFGGAVLLLQADDRPDFRTAALVEMDIAPLDLQQGDALARLLAAERQPVDLRHQERQFDAATVASLQAARAAFAVPLFFEELLMGVIILCRPIVKNEVYDEEDRDLMDAFARQTSLAILNIRFTEQLAAIRESEILGRVSTFIVHDLKNLVYTLSLTVENARTYLHEPEFQEDMLRSLTNTVARMKTLISQLRPVPAVGELQVQPVDLTALAREAAMDINPGRVSVRGPAVMALADRESLRKVLTNLLLNAMEASGEGQEVIVEIGSNSSPFIKICDMGCGMQEEFVRNRLFQPFNTTKPNGMGIGLYQSRQIVEALGGRIEVRSTPGAGSEFTISLPAGLAPSGAAAAAHS
ncbi:PEP-CTERM system histidine kinase PrsK [Megalodesulfovibrio paquesii]